MWDSGANDSHTLQHNRNHSPCLFLSPGDEIQFSPNLNPSSSWGSFKIPHYSPCCVTSDQSGAKV